MPAYEVHFSGIITELNLDIDLTHSLSDKQREAAGVHGSGGNWWTYSSTKKDTPNPERTAASRAFFRLAHYGLISPKEARRAAGFLSARPFVATVYVKIPEENQPAPPAVVQAPAYTRWGYGDDNNVYTYGNKQKDKNGKPKHTNDDDAAGGVQNPEDLFPADF